jgi:hypothetical protein
MSFQVDEPVWVSLPITDHVRHRFRAVPGRSYDAASRGEGARVAKFLITFVGGGSRPDEEVQADTFMDRPPFVDFYEDRAGTSTLVARYRQEEVRRILRQS